MKRSTWRRLGALAVLPVLGSTALTACGSDDDGDGGSDSKTITFAYQIANPDAKSVFATLAEEYEKTHKGVTVKTNPIALNTYGSTITTQLQAGNGPDVFFINAGGGQAGSVGTLGEAGKLLDLTGEVADGSVPDNAVSSMSYDDKLVAVPVYLAPAGIIFSPMAAEASGFTFDSSSTMEDVIAQCETVADGDQAVFGLAGSMAPNTGIFTAALAASTVYGPEPDWNEKKAAGDTSFADSEGWRDALQTMQDLFDAGCFQEGAAGAGFDALTNGMGQGQMLGFAAPGGAAKDIMDSTGGAVTLTVQAMPAPAGYDTYLMAGTPDAIAGNAASGNKDLAGLHQLDVPARADHGRRRGGRGHPGGHHGQLHAAPAVRRRGGSDRREQDRAVPVHRLAERRGVQRPRYRRHGSAHRPDVGGRCPRVAGQGLGLIPSASRRRVGGQPEHPPPGHPGPMREERR